MELGQFMLFEGRGSDVVCSFSVVGGTWGPTKFCEA